MFFWSQQSRVKLQFIQTGKPTQNAIVESFNGRFRDGCFNQHWFKELGDARIIIDDWRKHHNEERPTAHWVTKFRQCSNEKQPDMMLFPSTDMGYLRGEGQSESRN